MPTKWKNFDPFWYNSAESEILDGVQLPESWKGKALKKGMDTLDVWIDSGSSHNAVLARNPDLSWPADLYFEGSDQHRGWFQSSLWTAIATRSRAPYKKVITHGFIVDEQRKKYQRAATANRRLPICMWANGAPMSCAYG
ncbi:MAG: class I tRNA ligase family protein [Bacilli bacterium]